MKPKLAKVLRVVTAACIGAFALTTAYALFLHAPSIIDSFPKVDRDFDRAAWVKTPEEHRYVFTDDLIDRRILVGMSRSEVVALLGPPARNDPSEIMYVVDDDGIDAIVLSLEIGLEGRVLRVRVRRT